MLPALKKWAADSRQLRVITRVERKTMGFNLTLLSGQQINRLPVDNTNQSAHYLSVHVHIRVTITRICGPFRRSAPAH